MPLDMTTGAAADEGSMAGTTSTKRKKFGMLRRIFGVSD